MKPTTNKSRFVLAVDPGVTGWMAVVSYKGVHAVRPIPMHPVVSIKTRKVFDKEKGRKVSRKVEVTDNYVNYAAVARAIKYFQASVKRRTETSPRVVYESVFPRPGQNVSSTVKQHIGIHTWPIACACLSIECYEVPVAWKATMKLNKDKSKSIKMMSELCPNFNCGKSHDVAEACLLGYHYLKAQEEND